MRLIIESGATKSDWRVVSDAGQEVARYAAAGTNVSTMQMKAVETIIGDVCKQIAEQGIAIESVNMYTAGVVTESVQRALPQAFRTVFAKAEIAVMDDLTAAARAACGHSAGIVSV